MNDIDYDKLSSMEADKVSSQIAEKLIQKTTNIDDYMESKRHARAKLAISAA